MIQGFNHNIKYKNIIFHIQTEDLGKKIAKIITHVFIGGDIIKTIKKSYNSSSEKYLKQLMKEQHKTAISKLISGQYDEAIKLFQYSKNNIKQEDMVFLDNSYVINKQLEYLNNISSSAKNDNIDSTKPLENSYVIDKQLKQINKISKLDIDKIQKEQKENEQIEKYLKKINNKDFPKLNKLSEDKIKEISDLLSQIPILEAEDQDENKPEKNKDIDKMNSEYSKVDDIKDEETQDSNNDDEDTSDNLDQMILDFLENS